MLIQLKIHKIKAFSKHKVEKQNGVNLRHHKVKKIT